MTDKDINTLYKMPIINVHKKLNMDKLWVVTKTIIMDVKPATPQEIEEIEQEAGK